MTPLRITAWEFKLYQRGGGRENFAFKFCSKEKREYFKKGNLMNCAGSSRRGNIPILYTIDSADHPLLSS